MCKFLKKFLLVLFISFGFYANFLQASIKVGYTPNHPLIFLDKYGMVTGVYGDILNKIAASEQWVLNYELDSYAANLRKLKSGEIDLMVDIPNSQFNKENFNLATNHIITNLGELYSRTNLSIKAYANLYRKSIVGVTGDYFYEEFKAIARSSKLYCRYKSVDSYENVFKLLESGEIDAGIVPRTFGRAHYSKYSLRLSSLIFSPIEFFIAGNKKNSKAIIATIDKYLQEYKSSADSVYYQAMDHWFLNIKQDHSWYFKLKPYLLSFCILLLVSFGIIYITIYFKHSARAYLQLKMLDQESSAAERYWLSGKINSQKITYQMASYVLGPLTNLGIVNDILLKQLTSPVLQKLLINNQRILEKLSIKLKDISDYVLLESGLTVSTITPFELNELFFFIEAKYILAAQQKNLSFTIKSEQLWPQYVVGDYYHLKHVISIIVENALQNTRDGGIDIDFKLQNNSVLLCTIADTGSGITKEKQQNIFLPFNTEESEIRLGLTLCKALLNLMKGSLSLESKSGSGTKITIQVPLSLANKKISFCGELSPQELVESWQQQGYSEEIFKKLIVYLNELINNLTGRELINSFKKFAAEHSLFYIYGQLKKMELYHALLEEPELAALIQKFSTIVSILEQKFRAKNFSKSFADNNLKAIVFDLDSNITDLLTCSLYLLGVKPHTVNNLSELQGLLEEEAYDLCFINTQFLSESTKLIPFTQNKTAFIGINSENTNELNTAFDHFISNPITIDKLRFILNQYICSLKTVTNAQNVLNSTALGILTSEQVLILKDNLRQLRYNLNILDPNELRQIANNLFELSPDLFGKIRKRLEQSAHTIDRELLNSTIFEIEALLI